MKVADVMTRKLISVDMEASIFEAIRLMLDNKVSGLPVLDAEGSLVGIVTEGDFLRRAETATEKKRPRWLEFLMGPGRLAENYVRAHGRKVGEIMTPNPATVSEDTPLDDVVKILEQRRIKRMPVVRGRRVVGIISRANLLHALAAIDIPGGDVLDSAIRDKVLAELEHQPWVPKNFNLVVHNGVVELFGAILDERERQAVRVLVENVQGVKAVKDHLAWLDQASEAPIMPM